jgi:hypothetical protein
VQENTSPGKIAARAVSILFHPVFVPAMVYAFLLLCSPDFFFGVPVKSQTWWLVIISYITITFPLLVVFLLWRLKFIDSMLMQGTNERYGPLIASMLFYFWTFWLFHHQFEAPMLLQSFLLGVFLTTVFLFMATIFFKISLHAGAWGSVVVFAMVCAFHRIHLSPLMIVLSLLVAGLVGTARLYLQAHNKRQLYSGYILGVLAQLLAYIICKIFI